MTKKRHGRISNSDSLFPSLPVEESTKDRAVIMVTCRGNKNSDPMRNIVFTGATRSSSILRSLYARN